MIDFVLGLLFAGLFLRGWLRGLVRELLDLAGLVLGLWIAFSLSAPLGGFLAESFGVTPEAARVGAGLALFVLLGLALSLAASLLSTIMSFPGLTVVNRAGGMLVAGLWGVAIVVVLANVARALPLTETWDDEVAESTVVSAIAGSRATPQEVFETLAGDNVMGALAVIQDIFGESRAVPEGDEVLAIPPARDDEVRQVREETPSVVREVNEFRAGLGAPALRSSALIAEVAEAKAIRAYLTGELARGECFGPLLAAGMRVLRCGETLALAGVALGALDGMLDTESGRRELANPGYDRAGVSVVKGPAGRLVVVVLAG